jgi:hypothetical protein
VELAFFERHLAKHLQPGALGDKGAKQALAFGALELLKINLGWPLRCHDGRNQLRAHVQAAVAKDAVFAHQEAPRQEPDR